MRRAVLLAAVAFLAAGAVSVGPAGAAPSCANQRDARNRWNAVPLPPGVLRDIDQVDADPCVLIATTPGAVLRSADGGLSWDTAVKADVLGPVFTEGLGSGVVVPYMDGLIWGLLVSHDQGLTFEERNSPDVPLVVVTGSPSGSALYAVGGDKVPTIYRSDDDAVTWTALLGSAVVRNPVAFVPGIANDGSYWAAGAPAGVFHATAEGAVLPVRSDAAHAIVADRHVGDDTETVLLATDAGVLRSSDGVNWTTVRDGPVTALRAEPGRVNALMAIRDGVVERSTNDAATWRDVSTGLPRSCAPRGLARTATLPATFLTYCPGVGYFRYATSGRDLVGHDFPPVADPTVDPFGMPMPILGEVTLTGDPNNSDGSLAFDGRVLYWTDGTDEIQRMVLATRTELPPFPGSYLTLGLSVDPIRQVLYEFRQDPEHGGFAVNAIDLATGTRRRAIAVDSMIRVASWSWDRQRDAFYAVEEMGTWIVRMDLSGDVTRVCSVPELKVGDGPWTTGGAAYVAIGGGYGVIETEDDKTVLKVDGSCRVVARLSHRLYAEATRENDTLVCDGLTFGEPAVWIRDAARNVATAYAAPGAYCPLATRTEITAPATVASDGTAKVCGTLRLRSDGSPIRGESLALFAEDRPVATARTDRAGRVCGTYRPADLSLLSRRADTASVFLGTAAYLSSDAYDDLDVVALRPRPAPPAVERPQPRVAAVVAPPAAPPVVVNAPNVNLQPNPNPQANPNPNPQGAPNAAAGFSQQDEAETGLVVARARDESPVVPFAGAVVLSMVALGMVRRRARTEVVTGGGARSRSRCRP